MGFERPRAQTPFASEGAGTEKLDPNPQHSLTDINRAIMSLKGEVESLRAQHEKDLNELRMELKKLREQVDSMSLAPLPSEGPGSLHGLLYRTVEKTAAEITSNEVASYCREIIPKEVEKTLPNVLADEVKKHLSDMLGLDDKKHVSPKETAEPIKEEPPQKPEAPAPMERKVSVESPEYGVVWIKEAPPPAPAKPKEVEKPPAEPRPEVRFERDGEYVSIFEGNRLITAVSSEKTASGIQFNCGTCALEAMKKGQGPPFGECVHIQMVKKYLESLAERRST
jgi:hypothetical protein